MANASLSSSFSLALPRSRVSKLGFSLQISPFSHLVIARFPSLLYGSLAADRLWQRGEIVGNASRSSINSADTLGSSSTTTDHDEHTVPLPIVLIDQDLDPSATMVQLSFGDRLGALIDTMRALKDLGLDVTKGTVNAGDSTIQTKFFITRILLCIEAADRPGLLLEIIKILADINVNVESAEIDTEGLVAKDKFHVSYRGAALNDSLLQVLVNCLRYYLRRPETEEDSY